MRLFILLTMLLSLKVNAQDIKDCDKSPEFYRSSKQFKIVNDDVNDVTIVKDSETNKVICIID